MIVGVPDGKSVVKVISPDDCNVDGYVRDFHQT
jgi:hypothetical protein